MGAIKSKSKQLSTFVVVPVADGELGIENLKKILTVVITFLVDIITVLKNGNWIQLATTIFNLVRFGNIIALARQAWDEFKDVSAPESREVVEHIKLTLDLEDDDVEHKIEAAVALIPEVYELILELFEMGARGAAIWQEVSNLFGKGGKIETVAAVADVQDA